MTEEICIISYPTAMLWREKVFSTVDGYQEHLYLENRVWLDETYLYDNSLLHDDSYKKRGLSKNQLCIVVAIDCHKNTYAVICGHGKPSASRIFEALKNHIISGSTLVHDGKKHMTKNIYRFIRMRMTNLQSCLNWFVYLFRVKDEVEQ